MKAAMPIYMIGENYMNDKTIMIQRLNDFLSTFRRFNASDKRDKIMYHEMEYVIGEFSSFILDKRNVELWNSMECQADAALTMLAEQLRNQSAFCVWTLEKYRAIELQENRRDVAGYFRNIEGCIESEFGSFEITCDSKVLMIGIGAFPMTPLLIAKKTGAEIVGIDTDSEAVDLAKEVIAIAYKNARIAIEERTVDQLEFTRIATHIIYSSTVKEKFAILKQLHPLTDNGVVVAMRYGNGFKSLFNYPLERINDSLWQIVNNISQEENIFDIALYKKAVEEVF